MKKYYQKNKDFRDYVDKFCKKHKISVEEAMKHRIVKEVYEIKKGVSKWEKI